MSAENPAGSFERLTQPVPRYIDDLQGRSQLRGPLEKIELDANGQIVGVAFQDPR